MLSRTAEGLFWMARYVERAENIARLLEAGRRFDGLPSPDDARGNEWGAILEAAGCKETFGRPLEEATAESAIRHLIHDPKNLSSIQSCFAAGRVNARAQRIALTAEVWSGVNDAWRETRDIRPADYSGGRLVGFIEACRARASLVRGAIEGTQLRRHGYNFLRLGQFIERADATARLVDVKYHVLLPREGRAGDAYDQLQWTHLLRAAGARSAYRWEYKKAVRYDLVAGFLILDPHSPRSVRYCIDRVHANIEKLSQTLGISPYCLDMAATLRSRLVNATAQHIIESGLHEYLTQLIIETNTLAIRIAQDFNFGGPAIEQTQT